MFGTFRTLLAFAVVFHHVRVLVPFGNHAVGGFFILSGFLMTLVMQKSYGYSAGGMRNFAMNRALRLLPSYWGALALTLLCIAWIGPDAVRAYNPHMGIPDEVGTFLQNLLLFYLSPFPQDIAPRISPATWAISVEVFYYALIAFGLSRSRRITWLWFVLALAWHVGVVMLGLDKQYWYFNVFAGALPFSIGALIFHHRERLSRPLDDAALPLAVGLFAGFVGLAYGIRVARWHVNFDVALLGYYLNFALCAALVLCLSNIRRPAMKAADKWIGDFSYHTYVLHWIVATVWATQVFGVTAPNRSETSFWIAMLTVITCCGLSLLLTRFIDEPVERHRKRLRERAMPAGETAAARKIQAP
ncbi:acyltransferase family protein [Tranquillimonas rosea]|uniref:acyltransferase family protein n=1 Tax=Tranquillimonas rosea TaxID=641238 RepID=UPI003BAA8C7A